MTREQAINYLISSGFSEEQVSEVVRALTYEPTTKNDLGVDCISRQDVLSEIIRFSTEEGASVECQQLYCDVNNMPSVTPQEPKTGHWIRISPAEIYECSECGQNIMTSDICAYKFCHGCGAKMVEPQESEADNGNDA